MAFLVSIYICTFWLALEQALQLSRASLARAQKETQDAFLRYTACLDAERQARQSVTTAEKRRDDISESK